MNISRLAECRICKGKIEGVLDLGTIYRSSFIKEDEVVSDSEKAPLVLSRCTDCGLVQLRDTIDLDVMYKEQYWYSSSLNKSMVSSLKNVVDDVESKVKLTDEDTVVDIGANDCTLLGLYSNQNLHLVGYDPAPNLFRKEGVYFVNDYFSSKGYFDIYGHLKAKVITAIAMFYDLPDPNNFVSDVKEVLADDGIFVIQFTDLLSMFKATAFDNICHEHLEYYRLADVVNLLKNHDMDVIDVSYNDVNGGSLRVTACHKDAYTPVKGVVHRALADEETYFESETFNGFSDRIRMTKILTTMWLEMQKLAERNVFLLGASTKGNTMLQVCGITNRDIPFAAEVNKDKFGLKTLGSDIKIISETDAFAMKPDYFFCPVWHFKASLLTKKPIIDYIEQGGKLVFPLPYFHIVGKEDLKHE